MRSTSTELLPPCTYQGGKHRIAKDIIDYIDARDGFFQKDVVFYDLCCGSGAVMLELVGRGFPACNIRMCDVGPWGTFWTSIAESKFDMDVFESILHNVPVDKSLVQAYVRGLAEQNADVDTEYVFLLLQACSFGGKQVWKSGNRWRHSSFRSYWQPTETSVRRSPVNPMQPQPDELLRRVGLIVGMCGGIVCVNDDISSVSIDGGDRPIVYIDTPYLGTTRYGYDFDIMDQVGRFVEAGAVVYVSLNAPLCSDTVRLNINGPKGGISGNRTHVHEEWLSRFS